MPHWPPCRFLSLILRLQPRLARLLRNPGSAGTGSRQDRSRASGALGAVRRSEELQDALGAPEKA